MLPERFSELKLPEKMVFRPKSSYDLYYNPPTTVEQVQAFHYQHKLELESIKGVNVFLELFDIFPGHASIHLTVRPEKKYNESEEPQLTLIYNTQTGRVRGKSIKPPKTPESELEQLSQSLGLAMGNMQTTTEYQDLPADHKLAVQFKTFLQKAAPRFKVEGDRPRHQLEQWTKTIEPIFRHFGVENINTKI